MRAPHRSRTSARSAPSRRAGASARSCRRCRSPSAARRVDAVLKPGAALTLQVDRAAEEVGLACFEQLAAELGHRVHLIADAGARRGRSSWARQRIARWCSRISMRSTARSRSAGSATIWRPARCASPTTATGAWPRRSPRRPSGRSRRCASATSSPPPSSTATRCAIAPIPKRSSRCPAERGLVAYDLSAAPAVLGGAAPRAARLHQHDDGARPVDRLPRRLPGVRSRYAPPRRRRRGGRAVPPADQPARRRRLRHHAPVRQPERPAACAARLARRAALDGVAGRRVRRREREHAPTSFRRCRSSPAPAACRSTSTAGRWLERRLVDGRCSVVHAANEAMRDALLQLVARSAPAMTAPEPGAAARASTAGTSSPPASSSSCSASASASSRSPPSTRTSSTRFPTGRAAPCSCRPR